MPAVTTLTNVKSRPKMLSTNVFLVVIGNIRAAARRRCGFAPPLVGRDTGPVHASDLAEDAAPRILLLGKGWFPAEIGGLDRFFRELFEHLPGARAVVVGPAPGSPSSVSAVAAHDAPLTERVRGLAEVTQRLAPDVDVVDAHFALYGFWPVVVGALRRKPLVVHFQGPWAAENVATGDASRWRHGARRLLEASVYRRADAVITLTGAFRQVVVERYRVSPWKVRVERPGVDLDRFALGDRASARHAIGLDAETFVVVCVRRLVERMGVEILLDAWESAPVAADLPRRLLIAGDGPLRPGLSARIAGSPVLAQSVELLGRVEEDRLCDLYRAADLNVVPTLAFEGFGLVVLEAAACGTASLVTDAGGLPEAVVGAPGSRVVAAGLATALATALAEYVAPPREELRRWAEASAWPVVAERHLRLYRDAYRPPADRPLRVVVLDHVAQLSGGEIALLRLLPHLEDADVHVVLAQDGPLVGRLHRVGVSVQVLALGEASRGLPKDAVGLRGIPTRAIWDSVTHVARLTRLLRRQRPDVVHANSLKSGLYGGLAARAAGIPLVWHLHDRLDAEYLPRAAVRLVRAAIRRLATEVIANSASTASTLAAGTTVTVVPSALPEALPAAREPRETERVVFGMVGRLTPWKGQHVFLEAFARAFPGGEHEAVLIGAALFGEEQYARDLEALVARLGITDRVCFRGFQEDVWAELAAIDVLVHASVSPEPFGQVVQEGMAMGLPVIAADAGGPAEFMRHDVTGLLVGRDDPQALVAPMQRLAGDLALRRRLGQAARESCARFAPRLVAESVRGVYAAAASSVGHRPPGIATRAAHR